MFITFGEINVGDHFICDGILFRKLRDHAIHNNSMNIFTNQIDFFDKDKIVKFKGSIMDRVIFLDIDGVLTTPSSRTAKFSSPIDGTCFDLGAVRKLHNLINDTDADIVISSAWRTNMHQVRCIFTAFSLPLPVGHTDTHIMEKDFEERSTEIMTFVKRHNITRWVAIDDLDLNLPPNNFVKTDPDIGLTDSDCEKVRNKL